MFIKSPPNNAAKISKISFSSLPKQVLFNSSDTNKVKKKIGAF